MIYNEVIVDGDGACVYIYRISKVFELSMWIIIYTFLNKISVVQIWRPEETFGLIRILELIEIRASVYIRLLKERA